jgi:hypothetical protein
VARIRVAMLAALGTLLPVLAAEVHGIAIGITAGCATLAAATGAWLSSARSKKNKHHAREMAKKTPRLLRWPEIGSTHSEIKKVSQLEEF